MAKKEPREKRKEDILMAAVDVFLEKGYEGASMDAIAQRARMSKGGLYHHFKSKDMILIFANELLSEPMIKLAQKALSTGSAAEGLRFYIREYLKYWKEHQKELIFFFLSMTKAMSALELQSYYSRYTRETIAFYEGLYQQGVKTGVFVDLDPNKEALMLMAGLDGMIGYLAMDLNLTLEDVTACFISKYVDIHIPKS